jgi:hypothetical protein
MFKAGFLVTLLSVSALGIELEGPAGARTATTMLEYQQMLTVQGTRLPVFGAKLQIYPSPQAINPDQRILRDSTVETKDIPVRGNPKGLDCKDAEAIAKSLEAAGPISILSCTIGIYVDPGTPTLLRVSALLLQDIGKDHKPIEIYVSEETRQIIRIR